ncbi:TM2 domain-containing protein [Mucilaginibacter pallidiroseus]|uniref:TM2 domain-containing protein n=1 Tax=Mucilaginibacter pallidiroseus TaxID=2599295 RepID=A0A563UEP5_9SPHI|nr:TM2 domain-containing protein [Mucilaginibacter pallidiroseus]TWR29828.1 TM2 domain-containing protein [Mucilaginibacter pallidiroseus]
MNTYNPYMSLPGITNEELAFLRQATTDLSDGQKQSFFMAYSGKRKSAQDVLIFTLLGFVFVAGIQRFILGQTSMGVLYLLTAGFCGIGTIVDLVNHQQLANEYNQKMAYESFQIAKMNY